MDKTHFLPSKTIIYPNKNSPRFVVPHRKFILQKQCNTHVACTYSSVTLMHPSYTDINVHSSTFEIRTDKCQQQFPHGSFRLPYMQQTAYTTDIHGLHQGWEGLHNSPTTTDYTTDNLHWTTDYLCTNHTPSTVLENASKCSNATNVLHTKP